VIPESQIYARIGFEGFDRLITEFYNFVRTDDLLQPMYPPEDMEGAKVRLRDFLIQRFGGPTAYSESRGHPRLRMRHNPFVIGPAQRDRWLELMSNAMTLSGIDPDVRETMMPYFVQTANHMVNSGQ
jgi:hemoglobin